jgi:hypothetical protein
MAFKKTRGTRHQFTFREARGQQVRFSFPEGYSVDEFDYLLMRTTTGR